MAPRKEKKAKEAGKGKQEQVQTRSVIEGSGGKRIARELYDAMKAAILDAVPESYPGLPFSELSREVARRVPARLFQGRSLSWYATTVKLDLEAGGLIERIAGVQPQRLRRRRGRKS